MTTTSISNTYLTKSQASVITKTLYSFLNKYQRSCHNYFLNPDTCALILEDETKTNAMNLNFCKLCFKYEKL